MRKLHDLTLVLVAGLLWFGSAYLATAALVDLLGIAAFASWPLWCGLANAILGWAIVLLLTRSEQASRLFYKGPANKEEGSLWIGLFWSIPPLLFFIGLVLWIVRRLLP
jgi:hypothetical protein